MKKLLSVCVFLSVFFPKTGKTDVVAPCSGEGCTPNAVIAAWRNDANSFLTQNWKTSVTIDSFTEENLETLQTSYASILETVETIAKSGKIFVLSAGETQKTAPTVASGLPILDEELYPYFINVVAYTGGKTLADKDMLAETTNLAVGAKTWSLAAPGTAVIGDDCKTSAANAVADAAAAVRTQFPYMNSRQIAGVLLSTASDLETLNKALQDASLTRTNYMLRTKANGNSQFLFFTDAGETWDDEKKNDAIVAELGAGAPACGSGTECIELTFEDAFGMGVLNTTDALKGPAAFEKERLGEDEYDAALGAYFYTVDMQTDSTWTNNIEQIGSTAVGLKKSGTGTLTLRGENGFTGKTLVKGGTLILNGASDEKKATLSGDVVVSPNAVFKTTGYVSANNITNDGTVNIGGTTSFSTLTNNSRTANTLSGTLTGEVVNAGLLSVGPTIEGKVTNKAAATLQIASLTTLKDVFLNYGVTTVDGITNLYGETTNSGTLTASKPFNVRNTFINSGSITLNSGGTLSLAVSKDPEGVGMLLNQGTVTLQTGGGISLTYNPPESEEDTPDQPVFANDSVLNMASGTTVALSNVGMLNTGTITGASNSTSRFTGAAPLLNKGTINSNLYIQTLQNDGGKIVIVPVVNDAPIVLRGQNFKLNSGLRTFDISEILPFNAPTGGHYTLIETTASLYVNSKFRIETFNSPYLNLTPTKTAKTYEVDIAFNAIATQSPSFNADELKVGGVIDRYFFTDVENTIAGFYYLSESDLRKKINEIREYVQPVAAQNLPLTHTIADNVYTRLFSLRNESYISPNLETGRSGGDSFLTTRNKVWGQFIAGFNRRKANKETSSKKTDSQILGVMFGYDFSVTDDFLLGITGGYAQTKAEQGETKTDITDWRAGVYFDANAGNFSFQGLALAGKQDFSANKRIAIPGLTAYTLSDYVGKSYEGGLNIGYRLFDKREEGLSRRHYGKYGYKTVGESYFTARPYVGGSVSKVQQDAYREKGHPLFIMSVGKATDTSVSVQSGLAMQFATSYTDVHVDVGYRRLLSGGNPETTAYFVGDALQTPFKTLPAQNEKDFLTLGAGFTTQLMSNVSANLWWNAKASKQTLSNIISASVLFSW